MTQPVNDNRAVFREEVQMSVFMNPNLSSFEIVNKIVKIIPYVPEILQKISRARFADCGLTQLPTGLDAYVCISQLDLVDNNLNNLPKDAFMRFDNLQTLNLTANNITKFNCNFKQSLTTLDLSFNPNINLDDIWNLNAPNLETLKLTHCDIKSLPKIKPTWLPTLRSLHLDGNCLSELPDYFDEFEKLEELSLFGNYFETFDPKNLPKSLKQLNLYMNNLKDWDFDDSFNCTSLSVQSNPLGKFPLKIFNISGLRGLSICYCDINGELNFELPDTLSALDIAFNNITKLGSKFIGSIGKLAQLIANNNEITEIADNFPEKPVLSRLILNFNQIKRLPKTFTNCTNLDFFQITNNRLKEFPAISCTHLRTLNLSFNRLKEIPDCFNDYSYFADFNVSFNELTALPRSLSSCSKITDFNISGNKFRVFPSCVVSYSKIRSLICANNKLSNLPAGIGSLFFLQTFDASNNHLTSLPSYFKLFTSLKMFSMAHNLISDIPDDFEFPTTINVLDLSYNRLTKFDFDLPCATSINLDCNQITSFNPTHFPAAKFISINCNPVSVNIPDTLTSLLESATTPSSFEMLNTKADKNQHIPPVCFHIMADHHMSLSNRFGLGYSATMGVRPTMEDAITYQEFKDDQHLFALFDGHTGQVAAATSAHCLQNELLLHTVNASDADVPKTITAAYCQINKLLKNLNIKDGCTAVSAFIRGKTVYTAGIGDSRIVLVRKDRTIRLTTDYKPTMRTEYQRLREAGLTVNVEGRIQRKLAVARTLGDFWCDHEGLFVPPEVEHFTLDDQMDVGLIIACDGVWDVITDDNAAEIIRNSTSAQDAASMLRNIAFALGSKDNISTMVVMFKGNVKGFTYQNDIKELPPVPDEVPEEPAIGDGVVPQPSQSRRRRR